jgi:hypothetical protein
MQFITVFLKDLIIMPKHKNTCNKAWFKIQNLRASSKTVKQWNLQIWRWSETNCCPKTAADATRRRIDNRR